MPNDFYPGADDDKSPATVLERLAAVEENFELFKRYVDSRLSAAVVVPDAGPVDPPQLPVAVVVVPPPAAATERPSAEIAGELLGLMSELADITLKSLATGTMNVERAADLKRRVFALAERGNNRRCADK